MTDSIGTSRFGGKRASSLRRPGMTSEIQSVAIIGCGLIGASWAALFLAHGCRVTAWDPNSSALGELRRRVSKARRQLRALGIQAAARLQIAPDLAAAIRDADLIQENAPEKLETKHALYRSLDGLIAPSTIIASSTSSFRWSDLSPALANGGRLVTAHPFHPPHLVPLVELYGANAEVVERAARFYRSQDRVPVVLKREAPGHLANRLASALWREAVNIVAEGIADVSDVDAALVNGPGLRWAVMGAHLTYHLGGGPGGIRAYLDHLGPSQVRRWASLGSPELTQAVKQRLIDGVLAEAAGRSIAELEAERDNDLIAILKARQQRRSRG